VKVLVAIVAVAALAIAILALVGLGDDIGFEDEGETQTREFVSVTNPQTEIEVDNGEPGESEGDQFGFTDDLQEDGESVGTVTGLCTSTSRSGGPCDVTFALDEGTFAVQGVLDFEAGTFEAPIVGGTGEFENAGGTISAALTRGNETPITVEITTEDDDD
jgi:hypothetical protein